MYLIDGHNVIGTGLLGFRLGDEHDEMMLVELLKRFAARTGKRITVVFDHGMPGGRSTASNHAVQVIFASQPRVADTIMMDEINRSRDTTRWIVVSGDEQVRRAAQQRKMRVMRGDEFARLLVTNRKHADTDSRVAQPAHDDDPGSAPQPRITAEEVDSWMVEFNRKKRL